MSPYEPVKYAAKTWISYHNDQRLNPRKTEERNTMEALEKWNRDKWSGSCKQT